MNRFKMTAWSSVLGFLVFFTIAGCTGSGGGSGDNGPTESTISGMVSGLAPGATVVLQNNASDDLAVTSNGSFTFLSPIPIGGTYDVSVLSQPTTPHQTCTVADSSGVANQNVNTILVTCTTNTYSIGVNVSGLAGSGLVLQNNDGDDLVISTNGDFSFTALVESGSSYNITVNTQPSSPSQTCDVSGGNGDVVDQDITSVAISCTTNTYMVGGTVTGLLGSGLVLQNNGGDDLSISANGDFSFASVVTSGDDYNISVNTQPESPSQTCLVVDGNGVATDQDIASVKISCSTYQVGVTVSGLVSGETLTLQNNGGDDLLITGNGGPFTFDTLLHDFLSYDVTISEQPVTSTQQCMVANGTGTIPSGDVLDIAIVCPNVTELYPNNGANWNDYVNNNGSNGFTANDTACDGSGNSYASCLHGGEMRAVVLDGVASCMDITADDDLGAFNWYCDESTGSARVISTGLQSAAALSTLIGFANTQWQDNAVNVYKSGTAVARTPTGKWWNNSLIVANSGGSLNSESVIYLVTTDPSAGYTIDADKAGLVIQPGIQLSGSGSGDIIYTKDHNHIWFEGSVDASESLNGVYWENVNKSVVNNADITDSKFANNIVLLNSNGNRLKNIHTSRAISHGLVLESSHYNIIDQLEAVNNQNAGVYMTGSANNSLLGVLAVNNDNGGNAEGSGILLTGSQDNKFLNITIANNKLSGFTINGSTNNVLMNIVAANNYTSYLFLDGAGNTSAANLVAVNNSRRGILLRDSSNNYFTGVFKVGNNAGGDCGVQGVGVAPGLIDTTCTGSGVNESSDYSGQLSDAVLKTNVSSAGSFVGKVLTDDAKNNSDLNGGNIHSGISDWTNFDNQYRVWSLDGDPFPSPTNKGPLPYCDNYVAFNDMDCMANSGTWRDDARIWDWSLVTGDSGDNSGAVLREVLGLSTGDDTISHEWSDLSATTFLRNATERLGDGLGNDDGLCETDEVCIYTPNIGAYQGHGKLISTGDFVDTTSDGISGVLMHQYESNSY